MAREIVIKGAKEHNLRNVSLSIPRDKLVVITGLSGSGKSSLAFDTIYAEGQRRYLESLSAYARQFMEQLQKPDVESIDGLSPSISIEQKFISRNPRSTVGTVTEVYDFLRLIYARAGTPHCYSCGKSIQSQSIQQITEHIISQGHQKFAILAPIVRGKKGEYQKELLDWRARGFNRARIDGEEINLSAPIKLKKTHKHDISIYIDRLMLKDGIEARLFEAIEIATQMAQGIVELEVFPEKKRQFFSTKYACADCGTSFPEIEPRDFSFNSPHGACPKCEGLGVHRFFDPLKLIADPEQPLGEGALLPWEDKPKAWVKRIVTALASKYEFDPELPFNKLPKKAMDVLFFGSKGEELKFDVKSKAAGSHVFEQAFEGIISTLDEELEEAAPARKDELSQWLSAQICETCHGSRLKKEMSFVLIGGKSISDLCELPIPECRDFLNSLKLTKHQRLIAELPLKEAVSRLEFLENVGLSYLSLSRSAATLSGGEAQRIRLATQIGSHLVGVLYVLDEPSIGLHQRDNDRLIKTLEKLRDIGNSVLVVEHDQETIERADHVIDLGPGAGRNGGYIVFEGDPKKIRANDGLTGAYLTGNKEVSVPKSRRVPNQQRILTIRNANRHNLSQLTVDFPLGTLIGVTGVSGSGKSSLIIDTLLPALEAKLSRQKYYRGQEEFNGLDQLDKVIHVNQRPIGRSPRSNPATYTGIFTEIRALFSHLPESKARGFTLGRFSFNVAGGRCEACKGDGNMRLTMHFLADVYVTCEVCQGKRYNRETMEVTYRGKNISQVLEMTIEEAFSFFERVPQLRSKLETLLDVGLGYVQLGQNAVTLSGGEAQRIKLARELTKRSTGRTLYILDEPTTGLHFEDINHLLLILHRLVDQGNTVIVIEHNLDVIKQADHLIDLGPEGGSTGGKIVFEGTPEDICKVPASFTGQYLKRHLDAQKKRGPQGTPSKHPVDVLQSP